MFFQDNLFTATTPFIAPNAFLKEKMRDIGAEFPLILSAVRAGDDEDHQIFFSHAVDAPKAFAALALTSKRDGSPFPHEKQIHGSEARIMIEEHADLDDLVLQLDGETVPLEWQSRDLDRCAGKNTALLLSTYETADILTEWLAYHHEAHGLENAIILRRKMPDQNDKRFLKDMEKAAKKQLSAVDITILDCDQPLGGAAAAAYEPYLAPDMPGKDRMKAPAINPFHAQIQGMNWLEILRGAYLQSARAVLHVMPSDIIKQAKRSVFDATCASDEGYIQLYGRHCYPWRVDEDRAPRFSDHTCIMFDATHQSRAWCVDPNGQQNGATWRPYRVGKFANETHPELGFWRAGAIAFRDEKDSNITLAPKTSLILNEEVQSLFTDHFDGAPDLPPVAADVSLPAPNPAGRRTIVTTMKNEGPFLLEWIAYHRAIGFDDFIVYTNDCTDGTDDFFDLLQDKGIVEHRDNPYRETGQKPQHAALHDAPNGKLYKNADWLICMDVDEYVNIHVGDGTLDDLFAAVPDANFISMTWRLIGNSNVVDFVDEPIISQFDQAAAEITRFPHQAWGVKTLYREQGIFKKMGVHRPRGLKPELLDHINWVNGSGRALPESFYRNAWRTGLGTYGYDLVSLNHFAVRSMESFLVKRDRGRVNHVDRDQGIHYWFRMNHNVVEETSIQRHLPKFQEEYERLLSDPDIRAQHQKCVDAHRAKIDELLTTEAYQNFFDLINSPRMRELSRYTDRFGMNIYELGPDVVSDKALERLRSGELNYYNVRKDRTEFADL